MATAPPGDLGLPFLGEALSFLKDPFTFVSERTARHGTVWKTRILGDTVVFFTGPDGFKFFLNPDNFTRAKGSPPHLQELFHPDAVPFLDGDRFRTRKRLLNLAFTPDALASYVPRLEALFRRYFDDWSTRGEISLNVELNKLAFDASNVLFANADPAKRDDAVARDFDRFIDGMFAPPVGLPWTRFGQAKKARDRLRGYVKEVVARGGDSSSVLGRLLDGKLPGGEKLSEDELRIELLHFFSAAHAGLAGVAAWLVVALGKHPAVRDRAERDVRDALGDAAMSFEKLTRMRYVAAIGREVRRAYPIAPVTFFGVALRDLEFGGFAIQKGWKAAGSIWTTLQDGTTYADPSAFDPERMTDDKLAALPELAYVPQGGGPRDGHRCPGDLLIDLVIPMFTTLLVRDHDLTLPEQDLAPKPAGLGPLPKSGLRATIAKRQRSAK
jgi:cytochrome P450